VRIAVTGSVASDHLMTFAGRFADSLVVDQLDKVALSFLVDDLQVRRGGCAANITFGLAMLGVRSVLVASVGTDFGEYRDWLEQHGVDCGSVRVSSTRHTARFVCTTDSAHAQIASFYSGAMAEAREIDLTRVADRLGGLDLVVVSPNDPEAMHRHTSDARTHGFPFVADPSQQLAWSDGDAIKALVDGATYLMCNEYEAALIEKKTGWSGGEIVERVGIRVVTLGADGVRLERSGQDAVMVHAVPDVVAVDPTGVGDGFRSGFLAGIADDLDVEHAARVGCTLAAYVAETVGTQEYSFSGDAFLSRLQDTYGGDVTPVAEAMFGSGQALDPGVRADDAGVV
jgi:adenosine kinase